MPNSILEKKWTRWYPKKIFFKDKNNNKKILHNLDKFIEEDFFIDLTNKKIYDQNNNVQSKIDVTNTEEYKIGLKKGLLESQEKDIVFKQKLNILFSDFENALTIFENKLYTQLSKIVLKISSYIIGKKINFDEKILLGQIKKIINEEDVFLKKPQLIVHPNNKTFIENMCKEFLDTYKWTVVYDKNIDVNSCKVKSESGDIDATIDARWQQLYRLIYSEEY